MIGKADRERISVGLAPDGSGGMPDEAKDLREDQMSESAELVMKDAVDEVSFTEDQTHWLDVYGYEPVAQFEDGVVIAKDGRGYYQVMGRNGAYVREADAKAYRRVFYRSIGAYSR